MRSQWHSKVLSAILITLLALAALPVSPARAAPQVVTYSTAGTYSWTAPADVTSVTVEAWGGGGGGGRANNAGGNKGGGGAGGQYASSVIAVIPGNTYTIVVGAGGVGGTFANGNDGLVGGDSTFNTNSVVAKGGAGGLNNGAGGTGSIASGIGTTVRQGGNGSAGNNTGSGAAGGAGGGGAGSTGNGGNASGNTAGTGTSVGGGNGGAGRTTGGVGNTGSTFGGGGGGGYRTGGTSQDGGAGANGQVRLSFDSNIYTYNTAGTTTWTAPAGVTSVTVELWGGGGNGDDIGGGGGGGEAAGGGGGGGAYMRCTVAVTPLTTYNLRVGTAGGGVNAQSWFINNATAMTVGGNNATSAAGAAGGLASSGVCTGTLVASYNGGTGGTGNIAGAGGFGGGGGSSGGTAANGAYTSATTTSTGGTIPGGGSGGNGPVNSTGAGNPGAQPGGGGSGAYRSGGGGGQTGSGGAPGRVIITINAALVTPTLSITNSPATYNGSPQAATVTCSSGGAVSNILYDGSATVPTNAGTYAVTANCAAVSGFTALTNASAGNFVISPVNQTASVTNSPQSYTGAAQSATVSCSGGGVASNISTGGAASQTNAGTYAVTADCPAVAPNYNAGTGLAAGNFVISPVNQTASVTNSPQSYTGAAQSATVSCSGGGVASNISTGGAASQTDAGTYAVTADCPAVAPNYSAGTGLAAGNFVISQIAPTASVINSPQSYTGAAQSATVSCSGGGVASNISTGGAASQTDVGTYAVTADCAASTNYTAASGLSAGNFIINPATPTASITNSPVTYNGAVQTATVICSGGGAATLASGGTGTNVGSYPATVDCAASANYTAVTGLAAGDFVINPAGQTITITQNAPASAANGTTFDVAATASSGLSVTITTSGSCSGGDTDGDATITMTSGTGTCSVFYDQAGNSNYTPAPQLQEDVNATESPAFTSANNTSFDLGFAGSFNITATGNPQTMTISVSGTLPTGITLTDNGDGTATLSGTPAAGTAGVYNLILTANNGVVPNGIQNFTLTVRNGPTPTIVNSSPDTGNGSVSENESISTTLGLTELMVEFSSDVYDPAGDTDPDDVTNPANYLLVRSATGTFATAICSGGVTAPDVAISVDSVTYNNGGGSGPFVATLSINSGLPLNVAGFYRLYVCGTTSIVDAANTALTLAGDGVNPGTDFVRNFRISAPATGGGGDDDDNGNSNIAATIQQGGVLIPVTGFAPNRVTHLPAQTSAYASSGLTVEVPSLSLKLPIVGVDFNGSSWDVTWLGRNAGYLEGSAYPTWSGNTVLTGHATDPNGKAGPFAFINELQPGQKIYIHNNGFTYVYEVRHSSLILPSNAKTLFQHEKDSWLSLVTCENFNEKTGTFTSRRLVRAVLISIIPTK